MRKFALYLVKDGNTTYFPLNGPHYYLVGPQGLGVDFNPSIASFDDSFFKTIKSSNFDERLVSGTLIVYDEENPYNVYHEYQVFLNKCIEADELYFGYDPLGEGFGEEAITPVVNFSQTGLEWSPVYDELIQFQGDGIYISGGEITSKNTLTTYRADVELSSISKTEMNTYGVLECGINFKMLTPWYDNTQEVINEYKIAESSTIDDVYEFENPVKGHMPAGIHVKFYSPLIMGFKIMMYDVKYKENDDPTAPKVVESIEKFLDWGDSNLSHYYENFVFEYSSRYSDCKYHISGIRTDTSVTPNATTNYDVDWIQESNVSTDIFKRLAVGHVLRIRVIGYNIYGQSEVESSFYAKQFDYYLGV